MAWISAELKNIYYGQQCNPDDIEIPDAPGQFYSWIDGAWVHDAAAEQQGIIDDLNAALEKHYDSVAAEKKYGVPGVPPRVMCALRAGMVGSPFQSQGIAFGAWMDTCNAIGYQVMDDCLAGERTIPTESELISMMPPMVWP